MSAPSSQTPGQRDAAAFAASAGRAGLVGEGAGLYRLLIENVSDYAIFALDVHGHILSWNLGAERLKGYSESEVLGKHFSIFYPPELIAVNRPQQLLDLAERDGRVEEENWRLRKDGTRFWADVVITALRDDTGALVGFGKVVRDLTERRMAEERLRLSEERFRLIVQSVKDYGIFMLDPAGHIASWNEGARHINGWAEDEIIGRHFSIFYPEKDKQSGKPAWELEVAAREGRFEDEDWRVRKDGSRYWANVIISAMRDDTGRLVGYAKVTRDLTQWRKAEERAIADAKRVAEAETANRTKSEFLASMSHELRTPLNAIGGYTELLQMGVGGAVSDQQKDYLKRVRASQQHLLALVNDLLNYARIEGGQVAYEITRVDLHEVVDNVMTLVEAQAKLKNLNLRHGPCRDDVIASADRLKTEQIVLNILSNAVKFTPEGGEVIATCGVDTHSAWIEVRDTGPGIPPEKLEEIFEPFVQLGRTLKSIQEGTGLGLAISRDLARAMGGNVIVRSTLGTGSTFRLTLPRP